MAIPGGRRFPITFDELFPVRVFVMSVDRAAGWAEGGKIKPAACEITGLPVGAVLGTDPSALASNRGAKPVSQQNAV